MGTYRGTNRNDLMGGSADADLLIGGLGSDFYIINHRDDRISERAGEGTDTAIVNIDAYTLPDNVENGRAGHDRGVAITGNKLANVLTGGAGEDQLFGGEGNDKLDGGDGRDRLDGGAGDDYMAGGAGHDYYWVDSRGDTVREYAGGGLDVVSVTFSGYVLPAHVEGGSLVLAPGAPIPASMTLTGNELDNYLGGTNATDDRLNGAGGFDMLVGYDGNDTLDGGAGADWMIGGDGDDTYTIDNLETLIPVRTYREPTRTSVGDHIDETADGGNDTALVSVSGYTLHANVENGIVTTLAGTVLSGNELANDLVGNGGGDTLFGGAGGDHLYGNGSDDVLDGGADADWLAGGEGNDTFVLRAGEANGDVLADFNGGGAFAGDMIRLEGYGVGAYLTHTDATHWAIHSADGTIIDMFTVASGSGIHASDVYFV